MSKYTRKVILAIESSREFGQQLLRGIAEYSHANGPWAFYREPLWQNNTIKKWDADGIILHTDNLQTIKHFLDMKLPTMINCNTRNFDTSRTGFIVSDDIAIGEMASNYFTEKGFRHFAYLNNLNNDDWSTNRYKGFALKNLSLGFRTAIFQPKPLSATYNWADMMDELGRWLKSQAKPLAVLACNDEHAFFVSQSCRMHDIEIPEDVVILGVDNDILECELTHPPLSSIALDSKDAGYHAAAMLDMVFKKIIDRPDTITIRPRYIATRRSTDIFAIDEPVLAEALNFINHHADRKIQVKDIADTLHMSSRHLQRLFKKHLGKSVNDEIRRVRTNRIEKLLTETNLSVFQIAIKLEYSSLYNICRDFKRQKGISPTEYRKRQRNSHGTAYHF